MIKTIFCSCFFCWSLHFCLVQLLVFIICCRWTTHCKKKCSIMCVINMGYIVTNVQLSCHYSRLWVECHNTIKCTKPKLGVFAPTCKFYVDVTHSCDIILLYLKLAKISPSIVHSKFSHIMDKHQWSQSICKEIVH